MDAFISKPILPATLLSTLAGLRAAPPSPRASARDIVT
jgi:hypothetical protein